MSHRRCRTPSSSPSHTFIQGWRPESHPHPCRGHEVPATLLFLAYGYEDLDEIVNLIARTATFDAATIRRLLYVTVQHTVGVRTREEALGILAQYMQAGPPTSAASNGRSRSSSRHGSHVTSPVEDLLHANVLPHLGRPVAKMAYLAHMIGILLNQMFSPDAATAQQFDKDFLGNKRRGGHRGSVASTPRVEVCGTLLGQQVRTSLYHPAADRPRFAAAPGCAALWTLSVHARARSRPQTSIPEPQGQHRLRGTRKSRVGTRRFPDSYQTGAVVPGRRPDRTRTLFGPGVRHDPGRTKRRAQRRKDRSRPRVGGAAPP